MPIFFSRFTSMILAGGAAVVVCSLTAGCGNGDDAVSASDAGTDSASSASMTGDLGCDMTVNDVHTCIEYQFLTSAQQTSLAASCTAMHGTPLTSTDDTQACTQDESVGSCEVATGSNVKQFTEYYSDGGYTADQAQAACDAAVGDFKASGG